MFNHARCHTFISNCKIEYLYIFISGEIDTENKILIIIVMVNPLNPGEIVSCIELLGYRICLTIRQTR